MSDTNGSHDSRLGGVVDAPAKPKTAAKPKVSEDAVLARFKAKRTTTFKKTHKGVTITGSVNGTLPRITKETVRDAMDEVGGKATRPVEADENVADADTGKNSFTFKPDSNGGAEILYLIGAMSGPEFVKAAEKFDADNAN